MAVRRGFTLVELIAVMVLLAVLSATAIPAIGALSSASTAGAAEEVARRLDVARAHAATNGRLAGIGVDVGTDTVSTLTVADGVAMNLPVEPGRTIEPMPVGRMFPGVAITAFDAGGGAGGLNAIWFDAKGEPLPGTAGGSTSAMTRDATLTIDGSVTITIHRLTGLVTR
ncbi:MAG: GspH/FimT family pseudopilin [Planctomycetota bacterium]